MVEETGRVREAALDDVGKLFCGARVLGGCGAGVEKYVGVECFEGWDREEAILRRHIAVDKIPVGSCAS